MISSIKLLLIVFLIFFFKTTNGQTILIETPSSSICTSKKVPIKFTTNGKFNPGNKFKVQLSYDTYTSGIKETNVIDVSTESVSNPIEISIPGNIPVIFGQLRIVSTDPVVSSPKSGNIYFKFLLTGTLSGEYLTNPFEEIPLNLKFTKGDHPYSLEFNDSTGVTKRLYDYDRFYYSLNPEKSTSYSIKSIVNECGIGTVTGVQKIVVNPINFRFLNLKIQNPSCVGDMGLITIDHDKPFNNDNYFQLYVFNNTGLNTKINEKRIPLKYVSDKTYSFIIPEELEGKSLSAAIESSSPTCVTTNTFNLRIDNRLKVKFLTEVLDVPYGETANIKYEYSGDADHNTNFIWIADKYKTVPIKELKLTDNSKIKIAVIQPSVSDSYRIIEAQYKNCSRVSTFEGKVDVRVTTGFVVSKNNPPITICENGSVDVIIKKIGVFPSDNKFKFEFSFYGSNPIYSDAKFINDSTLRVDKVFGPVIGKGASGYLTILSTNPGIRSSTPIKIVINSKPDLNVSASNSTYFNARAGESFTLPYTVVGGGDYFNYKILVNDGKSDFHINSPLIYPVSNSTYTFKDISSECGKTLIGDKKINLIVNNPQNIKQSIAINLPNSTVFCKNSSFEIPLIINGERDTSDVFVAEIFKYVNEVATYVEIGSSKTNNIKVKIPDDFVTYGNIALRVVNKKRNISSKNGYSNLFTVLIDDLPKGIIKYSGAKDIIANTENTIAYNLTSYSDTKITFSTGDSFTIKNTGNNYVYEYFISKNIYENTNFSISKISNGCGNGTSEGNIEFRTKPYKLNLDWSENIKACEGDLIRIPFNITGASPNKLDIQAQLGNSVEGYGDIPTKVEENFVLTTIPIGTLKSLPNFGLKIVDKSNIGYSSNTVNIVLNSIPKIKLTSNDNSDNATVSNISQGTKLRIVNMNFAYESLYGIVPLASVVPNTFYNEPWVKPTTKTSYSIKYVYNTCGYGTGLGSVLVKVNPLLSIKNFTPQACSGGKISIEFSSSGDFDAANVFSFELENQATKALTRLGETKTINGIITFDLPIGLTKGNYNVKISSSAPIITTSTSLVYKYIVIQEEPEAALFGNTTINSGESTYLTMKFTKGSLPVNYVLSDGTKGYIPFLQNATDYQVLVSPKISSVYTIAELSNFCGVSKSENQANVVVNALSSLNIKTTSVEATIGKICSGKTVKVAYSTFGTLSGKEKFTVQISDMNGLNFSSIKTTGINSPLLADIPENLPNGSFYRIRVVADIISSSSASQLPIVLKKTPTGQILNNSIVLSPEALPVVKFKFSGTPPVYFSFGTDSLSSTNFLANDTLYNMSFQPKLQGQSSDYKLFMVANNDCGIGKVIGNNKIKIETLTGVLNENEELVKIFPNPAFDIINIKSIQDKVYVSLVDNKGKVIQEDFNYSKKEIDIHKLSPGIYFLTIQKTKFKIIKL